MATDPVCGKEIDEAVVRAQTGSTMGGASEVDPSQGTRRFHDGKWYYFCGVDCRFRFMANPAEFVK
jgi:YHS domain-containing protein